MYRFYTDNLSHSWKKGQKEHRRQKKRGSPGVHRLKSITCQCTHDLPVFLPPMFFLPLLPSCFLNIDGDDKGVTFFF